MSYGQSDDLPQADDPLRLICAYLDDQITPGEFRQLHQWLAESPAHPRLFARVAILHSGLRSTLQHADLRDFLNANDSADDLELQVDPQNIRIMLQEAADSERREAEARARARARRLAEEAAAEELRQRELDRRNRPRRPEPIEIPRSAAWLAVAAAVSVVFLAVQSQFTDRVAEERSSMVEVAPPVVRPAPVATVTAAMEARWRGESDPVEPGTALPAGRVELDEGVVEFAFDDGTRLVGEAPFVMNLLSASRVRLLNGKMVAEVAEEGIGFTVSTNAGSIVDLGTEFGVDVSELGDVGVHVLDGEVALATRGVNDHRPRPTVGAGAARRIAASGGGIAEIEFDRSAFLREVPSSPYELAVLQSRPVAFWRFNEPADSRQIASRGKVETVVPVGRGVTLGEESGRPEAGNLVALFAGDHDGIEVGNLAELNLTSDFTVEAWIQPAEIDDTSGPLRFLSTFSNQGTAHAGFAMGIAGKAFIGGSRSRQVLLFTLYGVYDVISIASVQPGTWMHVAAVVDEQGQPTLYLGGQPVEAFYRARKFGQDTFEPLPAQWDPRLQGAPSTNPCVVGRHPDSPEADYPPERWQGGIDEIAVFNRQLSPEEIERHYQAGLRRGRTSR